MTTADQLELHYQTSRIAFHVFYPCITQPSLSPSFHSFTGDAWRIYPMYDFAHAMSDALEGITHSLCTLEFADHRPLYDWIIDNIKPSGLLPHADKINWRPVQTEFSRLNLQYTVLSKRKLIQLVTEKHVQGWDDPRMPTISGVRRRGKW